MTAQGFPSKGAIDRIGQRIRQNDGRIPECDLPALRAWRHRHEQVVQKAVSIIREKGYEPTPRVKTINTMVEKLMREQGMRLSQMQDIAGVRIVIDGGLAAQDAVSRVIQAAFPDRPRVLDRRRNPSHGYRALHVVVRVDGCLVEVQIRTVLQHGWAEVYERLADLLGRGIRYGDMPADPLVRSTVVDLQEFSERLHETEEDSAALDDLDLVSEEPDPDETEEERTLRMALMQRRAQVYLLRRSFERMAQTLAETTAGRADEDTTDD